MVFWGPVVWNSMGLGVLLSSIPNPFQFRGIPRTEITNDNQLNCLPWQLVEKWISYWQLEIRRTWEVSFRKNFKRKFHHPCFWAITFEKKYWPVQTIRLTNYPVESEWEISRVFQGDVSHFSLTTHKKTAIRGWWSKVASWGPDIWATSRLQETKR